MPTNTESVFSDDELNEVARKAKDSVAYEGDIDDLDDFDDFDDETDDTPETVSDIITRLKNENDIDIFQDVGEKLASHDMIVTYQIKKNGKFYTTKEHPYSWEQLQKDHCRQEGARFTVTAKNPDNGAYIKTQTMNIDRLPDSGTPNVESGKSDKGLTTQEILAMFSKQEEKAKREAEQKARSERETILSLMQALKPEKQDNTEVLRMISDQSNQSSQTMVALLTAMMQNKPQDNSGEMIKFMVQLQSQQQERTERLLEKMQENTNKVLEQVMVVASSKDEPEFTAAKVMEMVESARNAGYEQFNILNQLAEAKAQERAELVKDKNPESVTETLIKSLAPVIAQGAMAKGQQAMSAPQRPQVTARPTIAPSQVHQGQSQRRSLSHANGTVRPQERVASHQGKAGTTAKAQENRANSANGRASGQGGAQGLPSVTERLKAKKNSSENVARQENLVEGQTSARIEEVNLNHKALILETAVPLVIEGYTNGHQIPQTVATCIEAFKAKGVALERVNIDFQASDIEEIISGYGLDDSMATLLREFYEQLHREISRTITQSR